MRGVLAGGGAAGGLGGRGGRPAGALGGGGGGVDQWGGGGAGEEVLVPRGGDGGHQAGGAPPGHSPATPDSGGEGQGAPLPREDGEHDEERRGGRRGGLALPGGAEAWRPARPDPPAPVLPAHHLRGAGGPAGGPGDFLPRQASQGTAYRHSFPMPGHVVHVAAQIAALRDLPLHEVLRANRRNIAEVYGIDTSS